MSRDEDVTAAPASAKRLAALLREAEAVQRRLDKLAAAAAGEDNTTLAQLAEARDASRAARRSPGAAGTEQ